MRGIYPGPVTAVFTRVCYFQKMISIPRLSLLVAITLSSPALARVPQPIEPIDLPPAVQQGVDMLYIDPEIAPALRPRDVRADDIGFDQFSRAPMGLFEPANEIYKGLRRGLMRYRMSWGALPQIQIPSGPALKPGMTGERVALLRERLGLAPGETFDEELAAKVKDYQQVHGLGADGIAGAGTVTSLNLGADHYQRVLTLNLDRAGKLPSSTERSRYIVVDAGSARIFLFEGGRIQDSMKAIVGKPESATPMMAALLRYASINPYWNVPSDLAQTLIAPRVLAGGVSYLDERRYDVLSDWSDNARVVDPASIDWEAVAAGKLEIRVRQRPGGGNAMGAVKFMMPNDFGIYLHDTPDKSLFEKPERWVSNGCIRVEDAPRLATWLFGDMPVGANPDVEERVDLPSAVPVYVTYMTAGTTAEGLVFRADAYGRDAALLARDADQLRIASAKED